MTWWLRFLECAPAQGEGLTQWVVHAVDTCTVEALTHLQVHLVAAHTRRDLPDVTEGDAGEGAAPAHGQWDATESCGDDVTEVLPQVEALVRVAPHTSYASRRLGLSKLLLPPHLFTDGSTRILIHILTCNVGGSTDSNFIFLMLMTLGTCGLYKVSCICSR